MPEPSQVGDSLRESSPVHPMDNACSATSSLPATQEPSFSPRLALASVALLLAANIIVPLLWGDVYPFTSAPMFRDSPRQFCNYHVYSPAGDELPLADWNLHRIYDGNPVAYGVGVRPPPVLEQEFGIVHDASTVDEHVKRQFAQPANSRYEFVDIVQDVIGPIDNRRVGVVGTNRWRIYAPVNNIAVEK